MKIKNQIQNTYYDNHSKKLRQFIYKYRHLFQFPKSIWIHIFSYLNIFVLHCYQNIESEKKEIRIPPTVSTLELNHFFSYVNNPYQLLKLNPKNIKTLHSHEFVNSYEERDMIQLKKDIFFLFPFTNLVKLTFNEYFNSPLESNIFPKTLTFLNLGNSFNQKLSKNVFPEKLETLIFGSEFNLPVKKGILPNNLIELKFGTKFDKAFKRNFKFPPNLENLKFGQNFNQGLRYSFFSKKLKSLKIDSHHFDKRIQRLPRNLVKLMMYKYNHDIPKSWFPISISTIKFNKLNGSMLFHDLPLNLKHFSIQNEYIKPILFTLHSEIKEYQVRPNIYQNLHENFYLQYDKIKMIEFNFDIDEFYFKLPDSIEVLTIYRIVKSPLKKFHLPHNLIELNIRSNYCFRLEKDVLPPKLQKLSLGNYSFPIDKGVLPQSLKTIELFKESADYEYIIKPGVLPENLVVCKIHICRWRPRKVIVKGTLPKKLKELYIYGQHHNFTVGIFNHHLEKLMIEKFEQPIIEGLFPNKLKNLSFHLGFNHDIPENVLPKKLRYLNLGNTFYKPLKVNVLPKSLIHLSTGDSFNHSLVDVLPPNIKYLNFGKSYYKQIPYEQLVHLKKVKLFYPNITPCLLNKPNHVFIETFEEEHSYSDDNDSYGYYSD